MISIKIYEISNRTSIPSALCLEYIKTITFILIHAVEKRYCTDNLSAECEIHLENIIIECLRFLRSCCPKGETFQNHIVTSKQEEESNSFFRAVNTILNDDVGNQSPHKLSARTRKMCWQLVANLIVQNSLTQQLVWQHCKQNLYMCLNQNIYDNFRECTMILYNIFIGGAIDDYSVEILELLLIHVHSSNHLLQNDFYHIFLEHFINEHRRFVPIYAKIEPTKRLMLLHYIADHMKDKIQKPIQTSLLQYICKEFKKKSDCVLKTVSSFVDRIEPKEVVAMLDVIVQASSDERYFHVLNNDSSLFLNVGCLLSAIVMTGKQANQGDGNIFAPVQTLGQIAPNSTEENSIERDISYELKTMLVRVVGNLAYKNKTNQNLVSEKEKNNFVIRTKTNTYDFLGKGNGYLNGSVRLNEFRCTKSM